MAHMKRFIFVLPVLALAFALSGLSGCAESGEYPLNGIWSGSFDNNGIKADAKLAFINDIAVIDISEDDYIIIGLFSVGYESGKGKLTDSWQSKLDFTVKGKKLILEFYGIDVTLKRDGSSSKAHPDIDGVWEEAGGKKLAFVNDRAYMIEGDRNADFGVYEYSNKEGRFLTTNYESKVEFSISCDECAVLLDDGEEYRFARVE